MGSSKRSRAAAALSSTALLAGLVAACSGPTTDDLFGDASGGVTTGEGGHRPSSSRASSASVGGSPGVTSSSGIGGDVTSVGGQSPVSSVSSGGGSVVSSSSVVSVSSSSSSAGGGGGGGGAPPTCGDGVKNGNEECDGSDLGGESCTDFGFENPSGLACSPTCKLDASGCKATCDGHELEPGETCDGMFLNGHTCSEFGFADPNGLSCTNCMLDASTCTARCHNGVLEPGETCDVGALGGKSCTDFGFVNGNGLRCNGTCTGYDTSGCRAQCGNGVKEPGETCDGSDLGGATCQMFGYANPGGLRCDNNCGFDTSKCEAVCGNGVVEPGEQCDDGNTTSGDGCSSTCTGEGTTCALATPIAVDFGTITIDGTTVGGGAHTAAASGNGGCPSGGPDRVYALTAEADGFLTASLTRAKTSYDSTLYVSAACSDSAPIAPLLCADSHGASAATPLNGGEVVSFRVTPGATYYLFVDGGSASGTFELVVNFAAGTNCNDPIILPLEPGGAMTALGSTPNTTFTTQGSCGGLEGPDVVYQVTRDGAGTLGLEIDPTRTDYNSVLYARSQCGSTNNELGCSNVSGGSGETLLLPVGTAPTFVWVDGSTTGGGQAQGNYALVLTP